MTVSVTDVDAIFAAALQLSSPDERAEYVQRACGENVELRERVDDLLAAYFQAGDFLQRPPATVLHHRDEDIQAGPGTIIGPYKLLQQIGEGGMGVVFMAEQTEPIHRTVALKIIKPGMDTRQVIARFEAERQALAMMDHPSIAKVLDAGTTESGRPFFVMELVKGVPITKYCDNHKLTVRQRLELVKPVCEAVQHAHQKGIIHRDLKPTNVLVAEYDGKPVPKVIDFGVAKATPQRLTERTMFTEFGQVIGTVEYMSPEQAQFNQLDIDTRSDIYSLGVLLYELLTGTTPFERERLRSAAFDEVLRIIREEEPPKPSTRLSSCDTLPSIASCRHMEPAHLSNAIRGELDWIVMKCLEKDRKARYQTATALAEDVQRYLTDQPVAACPPSTAYRLKKFIRRNKGTVVAGTAIGTALMIGFVLAGIGFFQARRQTQIASKEAAKAIAISELLQDALQSANPEQSKGVDYSVRQLLIEISDRLGDRLPDQPEVEIELRNTIGLAFRRLGQSELAEPHFVMAIKLARSIYGSESNKVAELLVGQAQNLYELSHDAEAEKAYREAIRIYRQNGASGRPLVQALWKYDIFLVASSRGAEAETVAQEALNAASGNEYPEIPSILHNLVNVRIDQQRYAAAEELARRAVEMHRRVNGKEGLETGWGVLHLGWALEANKKPSKAESAYREALAIFRRYYPDNHRSVAYCVRSLSQLTQKSEDWDLAEKVHRERIRIQPNDPGAHNSFANTLMLREKFPEAEAAYREAVRLRPDATSYRFSLAMALSKQRKFAEAEAEYRSIIRLIPQDARTYVELGQVLLADSKLSDAETVYREAIRLQPKSVSYRIALLKVLAAQEKLAEADAEFREALRLTHNSGDACKELAWFLITTTEPQLRKPREAIVAAKQAVEISPTLGRYWNTLGIAQYAAGDWQAAVESLEKSMKLRDGGDAYDWVFLAKAHWQLGRKDESRKWYDKAVEWMDKNQSRNEELIRFRAEAAELLGIAKPQPSASSSDQPQSPSP
jgi:serine/threonine protein kinase/tetratricopeptide (TPR) repeat protein